MKSGTDFGFKVVTGAFGALVLVIVASIGVVLFRESILSIREFGLYFWITDVWDPVAAQFGARPFIWGTLYSSVLALLIAAPDLARHRNLPLRALSGGSAPAADLSHGASRRHSVDRVRAVGALRAGAARSRPRNGHAGAAARDGRCSAGRRLGWACCRLRSSSPSW